ncbi:MAG TPA: neutral zinc metallopeptidase [Nocardioidaceae bacterium]|nr:neutral zinc metallopeptidase [Nocardioidaceae bacterium]
MASQQTATKYRFGTLLSCCLLLLVAVSSCGDDSEPPSDSGASDTSQTVEDEPVVDCPVGKQGNLIGWCEPCQDYEGCFTEAKEMRFFYNRLIPLMDRFSTATYSAIGSPDNWYYISTGDSGPDCGGFDDSSYFYCSADNSVYVGEHQMWQFYAVIGDAAPAVGLAHEWGHFVQSQVGVLSVPARRANLINTENQADCIAGAWSAHMVREGIFVDDDFDDVAALLPAIASAEGPARDHGTVEERVDSWLLGYERGIFGCNSYFPGIPIISN